MTWAEFRYIRHGEEIPQGWELVADFDDCHHGRYSQGLIKKIDDPEPSRCPYCGSLNPQTHDIHGHTQTTCCGLTLEACCEGS